MNLKPNNLLSKIKRFFLCKLTIKPLFIALIISQTSFYPLFLSSGEFDDGILELYKNLFKGSLNKRELIVDEDLLKMDNCETILLIAQIGNINRSQLELTLDQIKLQSIKVNGIILISQNL